MNTMNTGVSNYQGERLNRILIFELNWLGDILFSFPFIAAIKEKYPKSYISCVVVPRYADLVRYNPHIDNLYIYSDKKGIGSFFRAIFLSIALRKNRYDACFFLKPSRTKSLIAKISGIKRRIGFGGKKDFVTEPVVRPKNVHRANEIFELAKHVGIDKENIQYDFSLPESELEETSEFLKNLVGLNRKIVVLNPGGNWDVKRWPKENFIELGKRIVNKHPEVSIIITGSKKDIILANEIKERIGASQVHVLAGNTDLVELACIFKLSEIIISADSGPLHLASSTGAKVIGIFCPTAPAVTGPIGNGKTNIVCGETRCNIPCYNENCPECIQGMKNIRAKKIYEILKSEMRL